MQPRPLPGRAGRDRRRRPPRDGAPRGCRDRRRVRGARAADAIRSAAMAPGAPRLHLDRQRPAPRPHQPRRPGRDGRRRRHRRVRGRHAGPGVPRARSRGSRCPTARAASTSTSRRSGCTSTVASCAESLGLPPEKVRLTLAGVGGAFGGREDLSMQVHACMLALHTGRPVKMVYNREESFFGHVHRHPCTMRYEHGATRDGRPRLRPRADRPRRRRVRLVVDRGRARTPPASPPGRTTCPTRASTAT